MTLPRAATPALLALCLVHPALAAAPPNQDKAKAPENMCGSHETAVVVLTGPHVLGLCEKGVEKKRYRVALGSGGIDKKVEGDARTPLGTYSLGAPRASSSYHTFIPVGYPTATQRARGFTGGAVGIHGPPRSVAFAGDLTLAVSEDWTLGCIALATDAKVDEVAAFVRAQHAGVRLVGSGEEAAVRARGRAE